MIKKKQEILVYGCKIGKPDYMEEILFSCENKVNKKKLLKKCKEIANKDGYNRIRLSIVNLSLKPNFIKTINI